MQYQDAQRSGLKRRRKDFVEDTELVGRSHLAMAHRRVDMANDIATRGANGPVVAKLKTELAPTDSKFHCNTGYSTKVIHMAMPLECYWDATGVLLECHWDATGMPLGCHWGATGVLLGCYWGARRSMSKNNKKEHAVVDTPGMQVVAVAALRSSCSEKQKGHAVVETDHTKG